MVIHELDYLSSSGAICQLAVLIRQYAAEQCRGCEFEPHLEQGLRMQVAFQSQKNLWDKIKVWFKIRLLKSVRGIPMQ